MQVVPIWFILNSHKIEIYPHIRHIVISHSRRNKECVSDIGITFPVYGTTVTPYEPAVKPTTTTTSVTPYVPDGKPTEGELTPPGKEKKTFLKRQNGTKFEQYRYCVSILRAFSQCSFSEPTRYGTTVTPYVTPGPGGNRQERLISSKEMGDDCSEKIFSFYNLWTFTE